VSEKDGGAERSDNGREFIGDNYRERWVEDREADQGPLLEKEK